jgi:hypothetical protein
MSGSERGAKPALTAAAATTVIGSVNLFNATSGYGMLNPCRFLPGQPAPKLSGNRSGERTFCSSRQFR